MKIISNKTLYLCLLTVLEYSYINSEEKKTFKNIFFNVRMKCILTKMYNLIFETKIPILFTLNCHKILGLIKSLS